jgi:hypothetical protein
LGRRLPPEDAQRVKGAWSRYLAEADPAKHADLVVRFDHPDRPAIPPPLRDHGQTPP